LIVDSMPIDYSKWDHLDDYSDSDEDGGNDDAISPQVTHLDAPSRITFGGSSEAGSASAVVEPQPAVAAAGPAAVTFTSSKATNTKSTDNPWTTKGGSIVTPDNRQLYWSQDRYSVQIRLELRDHAHKESVERVQVDGILPYADRHCATVSQKPRLLITRHSTNDGCPTSGTKSAVTLLEGDLPHPVHWSQEDEGHDGEADKSLDWTIERNPSDDKQRFVLITLNKSVPMHGLFVWWRRPLLQFDEITLEEGGDNTERSAASKEFAQAWDEAHRIFREKKRQPPQSLPS
jgi:hypothetical protein